MASLLDWLIRPRGGSTDDESEDTEPPERVVEQSPLEVSHFGGETVAVTIYQSEALTEKWGRQPEQAAARFLERHFESIFVNVEIRFDYEPVEAPTERISTEDGWTDLAWWWSDNHGDGAPPLPERAKDANVLLVDSADGGATFGDSSVVSAREIDHVPNYTEFGRGPTHRQIANVAHEVGHALGASHDMDKPKGGYQHTGVGWNEGGEWYRTPNVAGNGAENHCGQPIPKRRHAPVVRVHRYSPCFAQHMAPNDGDRFK